jgi:site-specific DNA recombinase
MSTQNRVALYARVSTQEQATEGVSIEAQLAALKAYAKSQDWEVADEYIDGGFSGGTDERPALKRLLADAKQRQFNIIAVCKLDRFFRNLRLLLNHLYGLEQLGIKFMSTQEGLDTSTPYGKFAVQMMGVIAEFERGRIGERVRDSRRYLVTNGNWPGGRTLYGYRWLAEERKWEVVDEEAEIVRWIYHLYIDRKKGMDAIVRILNDNGSHTRSGTQWTMSTVRNVLIHPAYKGEHPIGVPIPTIIDEKRWQAAKQKREKARSVIAEPKGWLLQGIVHCGLCGHVLKCTRKKPKEPRYYACHGRIHHWKLDDSSTRCKLPYARADWLEWGVWNKVKEVLNNSDKLEECIDSALENLEEKKAHIGAEILDDNGKLETLRRKMERLGMVFADGAIDESAYQSKLKQLKKQETVLLKCRQNIDPLDMEELDALQGRIAFIKEVLSRGKLEVTEFGLFGELFDEKIYVPAGFNTWRESDGELAIGEVTEMDYFRIEGTDKYMRGIDVPPGFRECGDHDKQAEMIKKNMRAILQLFGISVLVYPDRVEIKGAIPSQVMYQGEKPESDTGLVISSPSPSKEKGKDMRRGAALLLDTRKRSWT